MNNNKRKEAPETAESDSAESPRKKKLCLLKKYDLELVEYSEKSLVVFGDSRPVKNRLKELGGRFNKYLKHPGTDSKKPGWIFPKSKQEELNGLLESTEDVGEEEEAKNTLPEKSKEKPKAPTKDKSSNKKIRIVEYSAKSVVVFGDTRDMKDQLKELGGRFNKYLKDGDIKTPGWVFPMSKKEDLEVLIDA